MHTAVLGFLAPIMLVASTAFAQTSDIRLSIVEPENGAVVQPRNCGSRDLESCQSTPLNVRGRSENVGTNTIVLFIYSPPAGRWFFQGEATIEPDGSWVVEDIIVSGGVRVQAGDAEFRFVATAMSELPSGLSDVPEGEFPPPGTLAQSAPVVVKRTD